jgi:hypothetical protein
MLQRWHKEVLRHADVRTLQVRAPGIRDWWLGAARDPDAVVVEAPLYELFRALAGRRTPDQLRIWSWSDSAEPYVQVGLPYPFRWAAVELSD